ncbi:hypothetical protein ACVBEH_33290, partial [Roseateles sp. GG27B]
RTHPQITQMGADNSHQDGIPAAVGTLRLRTTVCTRSVLQCGIFFLMSFLLLTARYKSSQPSNANR